MLEKEVIKEIRQRLEAYSITGEVEWWERLQSLKIRHHGNWIQGCAKGTPDFIALIRGENKELIAIFIEAKSPKGMLRPEQAQFADKYNKKKDIYVLKVTNSSQLVGFINEYGIDRLKELPNEL